MRFLKKHYPFIFILFSLLFNSLITEAQDDHYWSQQFGAESTLLGGAMIGAAEDNSAIYYNPGALAFIVNPSLSVDANVYRMDKILIKDGAGKGTNLNSAQISIYPQIISGMINLMKNSKFKFSYTILTRNHSNILMNTRYTVESSGDNTTSFVGAYDYINQLEELWFGAGAGYKVSDKLGIGATIFTSYRGQSYQLDDNIKSIDKVNSDYELNSLVTAEKVKYSTVRVLAKAGLSYVSGRMKYGLTLTTPSFGIYGTGEIQRDNSDISVSENQENTTDNFLISDKETSVRTTYKHPLSIAAGIDFKSEKARLAISAEYFFRINAYHLMKPVSDPFVYPPTYTDSTSIDNFLHIECAAKPVLNFAIGFSHTLYKNFSLLLGFSTDFSNYYQTPETKDLLSGFGNWDIYHFSSGILYQKEKHNVSFGLSYALTPSKQIPSYATINQISSASGNAEIFGHSLAFVLGYTYFFSRND